MNNYLKDRRDRTLCETVPTVMAPIYGTLDPVTIGHYRYIMASDGLYIEARSKALHVTLRLFEEHFPYGPVQSQVWIPHGIIPKRIIDECVSEARQQLPNEWGGLVVTDPYGEYQLYTTDDAQATDARLTYNVASVAPENILLDIHSHGYDKAFFSPTDDADDLGFNLSAVIGNLGREDYSIALRLCIHGRHFPIKWLPWESDSDKENAA